MTKKKPSALSLRAWKESVKKAKSTKKAYTGKTKTFGFVSGSLATLARKIYCAKGYGS